MKMYYQYFKYILEHKRNVYKACKGIKGLGIHRFTHDLSKFNPVEFIAYAKWFYGEHGMNYKSNCRDCHGDVIHQKCKEKFEKAWKHHYKHNKHHWNYWIGKDIPLEYIDQMIIDWKAMSMKFGGSAQHYYLSNYLKIDMTDRSRYMVEHMLGLNDGSEINFCSFYTLYHIANNFTKEGFINRLRGRTTYSTYELWSDLVDDGVYKNT